MEITLSTEKVVIGTGKSARVLQWDNENNIATGEQSGKEYRILLDRKFNRYFLTVDGNAVMHDKSVKPDTFTGAGSCNNLISAGMRGWYNKADIKAFADAAELHFGALAGKLRDGVQIAAQKPEVK